MAKSKMSVYVRPRETADETKVAVKEKKAAAPASAGKEKASASEKASVRAPAKEKSSVASAPAAKKAAARLPVVEEKNRMTPQRAKQVILSHLLSSRPPKHSRPSEDVDDESTKELGMARKTDEEITEEEMPARSEGGPLPGAPAQPPDAPPQMPEMGTGMQAASQSSDSSQSMPSRALDPLRMLEAALFMSSQSLQSADLGKLVGIAAVGHVNKLLAELGKQYNASGSALEVVEENPGKWAMRIRASFAPAVRRFAGEAEIPKHALRTLAYVSRHEGITKRELFRRLGGSIYEDAAELIDKGFVAAKPAGRTKSLSTTAKFKQYFQE